MTIAFLGDSFLDIGNLTRVLAPSGVVPFPDPPYNAGKASNGLVLGEAVFDQLRFDPESLMPGFRLLPVPALFNPFQENISYAVSGATSGVFGSEGNDLDQLPIGLKTQVELFKQDIVAAPDFGSEAEKPDAILSVGSNDAFEVLVDLDRLATALLTPETSDDDALKDEIATRVVDNIYDTINSLEKVVDDVVIFGLSRLGDTPFSIQIDGVVDESLPGNQAGKTRAFLTSLALDVNARLVDTFVSCYPEDDFLFKDIVDRVIDTANQLADGVEPFISHVIDLGSSLFSGTSFSMPFEEASQDLLTGDFGNNARQLITDFAETVDDYYRNEWCGCNDHSDVLVINGIDVFEQGLPAWIASLPANQTPITELSYVDYLSQLAQGNPNNLPLDLVVEQFAFIDGSHPTSNLNQFLAEQIVPQIAAAFPDFGMG